MPDQPTAAEHVAKLYADANEASQHMARILAKQSAAIAKRNENLAAIAKHELRDAELHYKIRCLTVELDDALRIARDAQDAAEAARKQFDRNRS
jgi:hypothetical protein